MGCSASGLVVKNARAATRPGKPATLARMPVDDTDSDSDFCRRREPKSYGDDDELLPCTRPQQDRPQEERGSEEGSALTLSTRVEYAAIPGSQSQDVFGIVTLQAAQQSAGQQEAKDRQPLDLFCVLDVSGSMTGEKIELVRKAVQFVIGEGQPQDRLSIVTFNHDSARELRLRRMDSQGKIEATAIASSLMADGGTDIACGLDEALQIAEQRRYRNPVSGILLLTDGQDWSASNHMPQLIERAQRAGCSLYAFGFGVDHDSELLSQVAELAQTPFTFVEDVENIGAAFAGAVGGLSSVAAQKVEVTLTCSVALKKVHTPFPVTHGEANHVVVQIPDMLVGERRDLLVELSVPASTENGEDMLLLGATAKYWDLVVEGTRTCPCSEMRLHRSSADEPQPEMEPDEEVATQRNRVEVAQTLQEAAACSDAGRFDEAATLITSHEEKLRNGKGKSVVTSALQVELGQAKERMKSRSEWEDGGMAEIRDAMQMHKMQRATNISVSKKSHASKTACKGMYLTAVQESWIEKAK